jgi:hypothetical protein
VNQSEKLENKAILLIHFSARYTAEVGISYYCFRALDIYAVIVSTIFVPVNANRIDYFYISILYEF